MTFRLDHLIVTVSDLTAATIEYQTMGFTVIPGGVHASGATHNALICFQDGSYIELLAKTGQPPRPGMPDFTTWFNYGEGLVGYALRSDNLASAVAAMRARGVQISDPQPGGRTRPDGVNLQWQSATIGDSIAPFFIEDITPRHLRVPDDASVTHHPNGVIGVAALEFTVDDPYALSRHYQSLLGLSSANFDSLRLDDGLILSFSGRSSTASSETAKNPAPSGITLKTGNNTFAESSLLLSLPYHLSILYTDSQEQ